MILDAFATALVVFVVGWFTGAALTLFGRALFSRVFWDLTSQVIEKEARQSYNMAFMYTAVFFGQTVLHFILWPKLLGDEWERWKTHRRIDHIKKKMGAALQEIAAADTDEEQQEATEHLEKLQAKFRSFATKVDDD